MKNVDIKSSSFKIKRYKGLVLLLNQKMEKKPLHMVFEYEGLIPVTYGLDLFILISNL